MTRAIKATKDGEEITGLIKIKSKETVPFLKERHNKALLSGGDGYNTYLFYENGKIWKYSHHTHIYNQVIY